jgi:hypothetical protein
VWVQIVQQGTPCSACVLRYTRDGELPSPASPVYVTPFLVTTSTNVSASLWDGPTVVGGVVRSTYSVVRKGAFGPLPLVLCGDRR